MASSARIVHMVVPRSQWAADESFVRENVKYAGGKSTQAKKLRSHLFTHTPPPELRSLIEDVFAQTRPEPTLTHTPSAPAHDVGPMARAAERVKNLLQNRAKRNHKDLPSNIKIAEDEVKRQAGMLPEFLPASDAKATIDGVASLLRTLANVLETDDLLFEEYAEEIEAEDESEEEEKQRKAEEKKEEEEEAAAEELKKSSLPSTSPTRKMSYMRILVDLLLSNGIPAMHAEINTGKYDSCIGVGEKQALLKAKSAEDVGVVLGALFIAASGNFQTIGTCIVAAAIAINKTNSNALTLKKAVEGLADLAKGK